MAKRLKVGRRSIMGEQSRRRFVAARHHRGVRNSRPPTPLKGKMAAKAWRFKRAVASPAKKVAAVHCHCIPAGKVRNEASNKPNAGRPLS
ncbi:hypothetical protein [uncultured Pleomorphomonas sp.]|uniref:hypothetical protein n=1 Tax=uncultured Pleomorphomonas sp. TaxID=442121 RepID=UPI00258C8361|nr:hypothetical protein [uncultured Pleomorphomonas sp.]